MKNLATLQRRAARRATPLPTLGDRRAIRVAAGIRQTELAAALGVSRFAVNAWETGRYEPRGTHRDDYVRALEAMRRAVAEAAANAAEPRRKTAGGGA